MTRPRPGGDRRRLGAALALCLAVTAVVGVDAPQATGAASGIDDADLRAAVAAAIAADVQTAGAEEGGAGTIGVEILTTATAAAADAVHRFGGVVTGAVDGHILQAAMPAIDVEQLAAVEGIGYLRAPRLIARPAAPAPTRAALMGEVGPGYGPVVAQSVTITNADDWQAAGIAGNVKVGIVDFFDLGLWSVAENGPLPDAAHRFCRDTSAQATLCNASVNDGINDGDGYEHGVAVAQVVRDFAPGAELFLATVGTASDLQAAIDWFAANGVAIINRSIGAAYDGPGDGTGPLAAVVDSAAAQGMVWFNSAGNDAADGYARVMVGDLGPTGGYVDFDNGPGIDTLLRISGDCVLFDGIRWDDWYLPPAQRTDYVVEIWAPTTNPDANENVNPTNIVFLGAFDATQAAGAAPLEGADEVVCAPNTYGFANGVTYLRIRRKSGSPTVGGADVMEIALGTGYIELNRSQAPYSAAKPVVDSRSPALVAVGAVDPANGSGTPQAIGAYSSRGPTNDGRIKPDVVAPSCVASPLYSPNCFRGTSAASPAAAGIAALLLDAGIALRGPPLAAAVRHFTIDRNAATGSTASPDGWDNVYGAGEIRLPAPPTAAPLSIPAVYQPLTPYRALDTRITSPVGPANLIGVLPPHGVVDLVLGGAGVVPSNATAVAINLTSTDAVATSYVQAVPFLHAPLGSSSTLNIGQVGSVRPNFAIVPLGVDGAISIYSVPGGNVVVDVLGYFAPVSDPVAAGRFVAVDPERVLDTREAGVRVDGASIVVPHAAAVPATGVAALVLNVTATDAALAGFLRAQPTGTVPSTSTVNYLTGVPAANTVIVPLGADGTVSVFSSAPAHVVVDVTGYITSADAVVSTSGQFVAVVTARAYDSRSTPAGPVIGGTVRNVPLAGAADAPVPSGASAVSLNLTAADEVQPGFMTAYPAGAVMPATSTVNFVVGEPVANGALLKLGTTGALSLFASATTAAIVDINGYFTA